MGTIHRVLHNRPRSLRKHRRLHHSAQSAPLTSSSFRWTFVKWRGSTMRNSYLSSSFNSVVSLDMDTSWAAKSWDLSNIYWNQNGNQVVFNKPLTKDLLGSDQENLLYPNLNKGKVRQLFLERRGKGWDRSYPLEPIKPKNKSSKHIDHSQLTKSLSDIPDYYSVKQLEHTDIYNFPVRLPNIGGGMQQNRDKPSTPKRVSRIPQPKSSSKPNVTDEMKKLRIAPKAEVQSSESSKSKQELKPYSTVQRSETPTRSIKKMPVSSKHTIETSISSKPSTSSKQKSSQPPTTPRKASTNLDPDMTQCQICGRSFMKDRIQVHENICKKSKTKKRKVFDPVKQRLSGTEAEPYLRKMSHAKNTPANTELKSKSDWRKKHEEFISSIRAAKKVNEHLAKGGKLSDLPPPPASDTSDYVKCQHCGRKFNSGVAERHIPICSKVKSNKPTAKRIIKK